MADNPGMLLRILARVRVHYDVVDPATLLGSTQQLVAVKVPGWIHAEAWVTAQELRIVVSLWSSPPH